MEAAERESAVPSMSVDTGVLEAIRARCRGRLPLDDFVAAVSNAYHEAEAPFYDSLHPEIFEQVPPVFASFLSSVRPHLSGGKLRAVDIGCGTGFASELLLQELGPQIDSLVCADISAAMLEQCRRRLRNQPKVSFVPGGIEALSQESSGFDLVLTCSTLHHILRLESFWEQLRRLVRPGGFYFLLHEPSRRFYKNAACLALLKDYLRQPPGGRWRRFLNPTAYYRRLWQVLHWGRMSTVVDRTTQLLLERGVTGLPLEPGEIALLVDVHAPPVRPDDLLAWDGGFDVDVLSSTFLRGFELRHHKAYGFLGPIYEESVSRAWQKKARRLAEQFPNDGANFCALWQAPA